jgi:hydrogenase expression/formation protein HypE
MARDSRLVSGKVPTDVLKLCILPYLGVPSNRVLKGPGIGEDAPIIDMGDRILVVKGNPITGAEANLGGEIVHINANDVAARGAKPLWFVNIILLPEGTSLSKLKRISLDVDKACRQLGVSVIGGHTECTPGLVKPIAIGFMIGEAQKGHHFTGEASKIGDKIILTKGAGIEGTGILASDFANRLKGKVNARIIKKAKDFASRISIVAEARAVVEIKGVHSMHTPTEGGVLNGLVELAEAAGYGFKVREELIPIEPETRVICDVLGVDPLRLIASGALLITVEASHTQTVLTAIRGIGVEAVEIGEITPKGMTLEKSDGKKSNVKRVKQDELYRLIATR